MAGITQGLQRVGMALPRLEGSVVVLAGRAAAVAALYGAVDAALARRPGAKLVLAVPAEERAELFRRYPHELSLPLPLPAAAALWWRRLRPQLVVAASPGAAAGLGPTAPLLDAAAGTLDAEALLSLLPERAPTPRPRRHLLDRAVVGLAGGRQIRSLAALRARLGAPGAILCLGNGPSSEDPRLEAHRDAALFRVNWIWRGRGLFTRADMVFTADPDLPASPRPVIGMPSAAVGLPILARHALALKPPSRGYVLFDAIDVPIADPGPGATPTNGAIMIATAAALRPQRLVIAGMDLYQHPAGRYPGDTQAVDGYARAHSRGGDLAVIAAALEGFPGELVILSDALRAALG